MTNTYFPITDGKAYADRGRANSGGHPLNKVPPTVSKPCTRCERPIYPSPESSPSDWKRKKTCGVANKECLAIWKRKRLARGEGGGGPAALSGWGSLPERAQ